MIYDETSIGVRRKIETCKVKHKLRNSHCNHGDKWGDNVIMEHHNVVLLYHKPITMVGGMFSGFFVRQWTTKLTFGIKQVKESIIIIRFYYCNINFNWKNIRVRQNIFHTGSFQIQQYLSVSLSILNMYGAIENMYIQYNRLHFTCSSLFNTMVLFSPIFKKTLQIQNQPIYP